MPLCLPCSNSITDTLILSFFFSYILFQILPTIADIVIAIVFFATYFNGWFALIVFATMTLYLGKYFAIIFEDET